MHKEGSMNRTIIIAEIGENHIGDISLAKKMIQDVALAGADIVKFQSYFGKDFRDDDIEKKWFSKVELSNEAHFELKKFTEMQGVKFLSSPFSLERAKFLCEVLGLRAIKVASGMMLNFPVLDYLNTAGLDTVFVSTGMATLEEVSLSLKHLNKIPNIYIMHCVTQYPCKNEEANLKAILTLQEEFKLPVGYSDHTIGIDACIIAVALGASVIEKHFTFDKDFPEGTDHILSATTEEFKEMVEQIRKVEILLGNRKKEPSCGERKILEFIRKRFLKNSN